jgi:two-component system, OmpR family, osmolarity sensor histidine kinase EnvZ
MRWAPLPRINSLFSRLLLAQLGLVMALGVVFGGLFYVERNTTMAVLYAKLWAPHLLKASQSAATELLPPNIQRSYTRPASVRPILGYTPRFAVLRQSLLEQGVPLDDMLVSLSATDPILWLHVQTAQHAPVWLGIAAQIIVPEWPRRLLLALSLLALLLVAGSWAFTRRLTRPLEQLHTRMQTHTPGVGGAGVPVPALRSHGSPEIKAIDAAYTDLLHRLERHEHERSVLLAGVSHDLRSPLGRIRLAADLLPDHTDVQVRRQAIVRNVAEADRLVESFLDFVRSGELAFNEVVDLAATARAVASKFERPTHTLCVVAPDALAWKNANQLLVERLMSNLIDNALKHGRAPVRVSIGADAACAWIEVQDSGDGIDPKAVTAVQEAFTRGDSSRSQSGSGLGLAIVRQVVARLGGALAFERNTQGQRVRVTLPLRRA